MGHPRCLEKGLEWAPKECLSENAKKNVSYIQDNKLEGVIPSLGPELYVVWNQSVGRNLKDSAIDNAKSGTKKDAFAPLSSLSRSLAIQRIENSAF
jgi:hypothetical protein